MTKTSFVFFFCLFFALTASANEIEIKKIPPAFPEGRPHPQRSAETAPLPLSPPAAKPPGAPDPSPPMLAPDPPPPVNADWLVRRMAASDDPETRSRASEVWPVSEAVMSDLDALMRALTDSDSLVRAAAVERLEKVPHAMVFGYAMRVMAGGTVEQARALDTALPVLQGKLALLMLETLRTELETPLHRRIAAYCLGRTQALDAAETLGEYAWHTDATLARACADALYALSAPQTAPHWFALLEHPDVYFRQLAAHALAVIGGPNGFVRLTQVVLDENGDVSVQTEALNALAAHPAQHLYPLLVDVLERNQQLRPVALRLLRARAGVDFGWDMVAWRSWLNTFTAEPPPPPIVPGQ